METKDILTGRASKYNIEPRKPTPLGTVFWTGAECFSGVLVFQDAIQAPEAQSRKQFFNEASHLPGNPPITAYAAEVLLQVQGAKIPHGGGLVGIPGLEVYCWLLKSGCILMFILHGSKSKTLIFFMQALHSVLTARYGDRPAGHWVVFCTNICGVTLIAVCYAWSHSSTTYFLSTCGSTNPAKT
jgi:hypothetical protein